MFRSPPSRVSLSFSLSLLCCLLLFLSPSHVHADFIADLDAPSDNMVTHGGTLTTGYSFLEGETIGSTVPLTFPAPPYVLTISLSLDTFPGEINTFFVNFNGFPTGNGASINFFPDNTIEYAQAIDGLGVTVRARTTPESGILLLANGQVHTFNIAVTTTGVSVSDPSHLYGEVPFTKGVPTAFNVGSGSFGLGDLGSHGLSGTIHSFQVVTGTFAFAGGSITTPTPTPTDTPTPTPTPSGSGSGSGDPQFQGFQGQSFQVHGYPDQWFNLIHSHELRVNAKFTYLETGTCTYNNTQCWTHPGTYMSAFGITLADRVSNKTIRLSVTSGSHATGLIAHIHDLGEPSSLATQHILSIHEHLHLGTIRIQRHSFDTITIENERFRMDIINSDWFCNIRVQVEQSVMRAGQKQVHVRKAIATKGEVDKLYPQMQIHGLLGQTWRNISYPDGRLYQGHVDDYVCSDQFQHDSVFNKE